jgi:CBS domain-containing protein
MQVRDGMTTNVLVVKTGDTLRDIAQKMAERHVGSAVVDNPDRAAPGILTERDLVEAMGAGADPDSATVADYHSANVITAGPDWSLEDAASTMLDKGIRHLVVMDDEGQVNGIVSMRDIVRGLTKGEKHP